MDQITVSNTDLAIVSNTSIVSANNLPTEALQDYQTTRSNLYEIMTRGLLALDKLTEIAEKTQSRSDYRVIGELINALTNTNDKILDMHIKKKELTGAMAEPKPQSLSVDKAIFVSSMDLLNSVLQVKANT